MYQENPWLDAPHKHDRRETQVSTILHDPGIRYAANLW
jgi:hypothetical protein